MINDQLENLVDNFEANMDALNAEWEAAKNANENLTTKVIDLDAFFRLYQSEKDNIDKDTKLKLVTFLEKVLSTIKNGESQVTTNTGGQDAQPFNYDAIKYAINNDLLLKEGAKLVKALDKNNPRRKQAKKKLVMGILLTTLGLGIIAGLIACIVISAPAFAVGVSIIAAPIATKILLCAITGYVLVNFATIGNDITLMLKSLALPGLPLFYGVRSLMHSYELFKPTPEGLALALANTLPALAEKVHYGDEKETEIAKLAKAEGKLAAFQRLNPNNRNYLQSSDTATYINTGLAYYEARVNHLKKNSSGDKPSKDGLLLAMNRQRVNPDVKAAVLVNDHRTNEDGKARQGATLKLSDSLKGTLFAEHYHVKHAMKVEKAVLDQRKAAATARG